MANDRPLTVIRNALGQVQPGSSLQNNSARKRMRDLIDKYTGPDGEEVIAFFAGVMKGTERVPMRAPGPGEDSVSAALIPLVPPTMKERMAAGEVLMVYRHGAPAKSDDPIMLPEGFTMPGEARLADIDYSKLSNEELADMERMSQKARGITTIDVTPTTPTK